MVPVELMACEKIWRLWYKIDNLDQIGYNHILCPVTVNMNPVHFVQNLPEAMGFCCALILDLLIKGCEGWVKNKELVNPCFLSLSNNFHNAGWFYVTYMWVWMQCFMPEWPLSYSS